MAEDDLKNFKDTVYHQQVDLLAGGVPCPPFSKTGKQLGKEDKRDLFLEALRLIEEIQPKAVMLKNVRGFLDKTFDDYRADLKKKIESMGYQVDWRLLHASDFGVSQLRPRVVRPDIYPFKAASSNCHSGALISPSYTR